MDKKETIQALAALAHDTRLDVFRLLVEAGPEGLAFGDMGEMLNVPAATLNHHVTQLKRAGLVKCRQQGRKRIHSADYDRMDKMLSYLMQNCCQGSTHSSTKCS